MLDPMFPQKSVGPDIVGALTEIREEWDEAADGSLVDVRTSVGLLLADIVRALKLSPEEQKQVLGADLHKDLSRRLGFSKRVL